MSPLTGLVVLGDRIPGPRGPGYTPKALRAEESWCRQQVTLGQKTLRIAHSS
jgi:hypothetical protein